MKKMDSIRITMLSGIISVSILLTLNIASFMFKNFLSGTKKQDELLIVLGITAIIALGYGYLVPYISGFIQRISEEVFDKKEKITSSALGYAGFFATSSILLGIAVFNGYLSFQTAAIALTAILIFLTLVMLTLPLMIKQGSNAGAKDGDSTKKVTETSPAEGTGEDGEKGSKGPMWFFIVGAILILMFLSGLSRCGSIRENQASRDTAYGEEQKPSTPPQAEKPPVSNADWGLADPETPVTTAPENALD